MITSEELFSQPGEIKPPDENESALSLNEH